MSTQKTRSPEHLYFLLSQLSPLKMVIRVASLILLLVALTAAHGERYVVKKVMKAPQYQPYSVKSHGKKLHSGLQ